jgi:hypothetical protein
VRTIFSVPKLRAGSRTFRVTLVMVMKIGMASGVSEEEGFKAKIV